METVILLNLGSTSFKCKLYNAVEDNLIEVANAEIESIGASQSCFRFSSPDRIFEKDTVCPNHLKAFYRCMDALKAAGILASIDDLDAVGYKAVHGGAISGTHFVDDALLGEMQRMCSFAPAHNPIYLKLMREIREKHPTLIQVARFETSFHASIPRKRVLYGVPREWEKQYGIRRYGFHGSSHEYISLRMKQLDPTATRVLSLHLGGSSSVCAIKNEQSIFSSMGATPQSGLYQNNRVGDFDVFCLPMLVEKHGTLEAVLRELTQNGGLRGVSGISNDLRTLLEAVRAGNEQAKIAVEAYCDGIVGYMGMGAAYMGGLDAIVFTGGIGFNSEIIREKIVSALTLFNAKLDKNANIQNENEDALISNRDSDVRIWKIHTNEEYVLAMHIVGLLRGKEKNP